MSEESKKQGHAFATLYNKSEDLRKALRQALIAEKARRMAALILEDKDFADAFGQAATSSEARNLISEVR